MAKEVVTIRLGPEVIKRLDYIASEREETRSSVIERIVDNGIEDEESFLDQMTNPILRNLILGMAGSPKFMKIMGKVMREEFSDEDLASMGQRAPKLKAMGERRQREKNKSKQG